VSAAIPDDVPRRNGELVFDAPWESRAFGLVAAYLESTGQSWEVFRARLIASIAALPPGTPYYEAWTDAFAGLLAADGVVPLAELDERAAGLFRA
jgi:hypothetical protein